MDIRESIESTVESIIITKIISEGDIEVKDFDTFKRLADGKLIFCEESGTDVLSFIMGYCKDIPCTTITLPGSPSTRKDILNFIDEKVLNDKNIMDYISTLKFYRYMVAVDGLKVCYKTNNVNDELNAGVLNKINEMYDGYIEKMYEDAEKEVREIQERKAKIIEEFVPEYREAKSKSAKNEVISKIQCKLRQVDGLDGRGGGMSKAELTMLMDSKITESI